jgi:phage terminase Nu1 subunit (DNA packaging protein)
VIAEVPTQNELATALKVSRQTLCNWREAGAPIADACQLPLADAIALLDGWRKNNKRPRFWSEAEADEDGTLQERLIASQIRKHKADAVSKELKNAERQGELMDAEEAAQQVAIVLSVLMARLEQIPDEVRKELPLELREPVAQRVDELIVLALKECAAKLRGLADAA